jgi:hypothetical protein
MAGRDLWGFLGSQMPGLRYIQVLRTDEAGKELQRVLPSSYGTAHPFSLILVVDGQPISSPSRVSTLILAHELKLCINYIWLVDRLPVHYE